MKLTLAGCASALFALVAIATAPQAAARPGDEFLNALADVGISVPTAMQPEAISRGHAVCQAWDSGASSADVINAVINASGLPKKDASVVIRAATKAFCPKYVSKI
jgi:hypothetical protein